MTQEIIQTLKSIDKMTQVEFTNRTQVEVSAKEYETLGVSHLSVEEELFVENSLGISFWSCYMFKSALTLAYELGVYCGAIRA